MEWRKFGDYNTKYLHILEKIKKSRGKISTLQDLDGSWMHDEFILNEMERSAFLSIFQSKHEVCSRHNLFLSDHPLSAQESITLNHHISLDEIHSILFCVSLIKNSSPNGIQSVFIQHVWGDLKDIMHFFINQRFINDRER